MKNKDFRQALSRSLHQPPATEKYAAFQNTVFLAKKEAARRQRRTHISFAGFLAMQVKFIGWKIWGIQGASLLVICGILSRLFDGWVSPLSAVKLLLCLSVLVFSTALPFICRSNRYRMQEIEAASRFSSGALLTAKLTVIGIGDLGMLGGIFLTALIKSSIGAGSALLYVSLPFLLSCCGCLYLLGHFTPKWVLAGSTGFSALLVLSFAALPSRFIPPLSILWIGICFGLIVLCGYQFRYLLCRSSYTEMQIA